MAPSRAWCPATCGRRHAAILALVILTVGGGVGRLGKGRTRRRVAPCWRFLLGVAMLLMVAARLGGSWWGCGATRTTEGFTGGSCCVQDCVMQR